MICATLPLPPSVNALYRNARSGRVKTKAYRAWIAEAGMVLRLAQRAKRISGPYALSLDIGKPDNRRRDLGNLEKAVSDLLVHVGAVRDDADCRRIVLAWTSAAEGVFLRVEPVEAVAPVKRRLAASVRTLTILTREAA